MTDPSPEARHALAKANAAKARIEQSVPRWKRTADQVKEAVAANHFADMLLSAMRSAQIPPGREDPGETHQ